MGKNRRLKKMGLTEEEEMAYRIGTEERKLVLAQRKLESIRVLDELISRVKVVGKANPGLKAKLENTKKIDEESTDSDEDSEELREKEKNIRDKLVLKMKKKSAAEPSKVKKTKNDGFESLSEDDSEGGRKKKPKLKT